MSNPLLISPSRETAWRFEAAEFVRLLQARWPDADIRLMPADDPHTTLEFELPVPGVAHPVLGSLTADGCAVWLEAASIEEGATVAEWVRSVVPAAQELVFCDQAYSFDVPLAAGIRAREIVAAVDTA